MQAGYDHSYYFMSTFIRLSPEARRASHTTIRSSWQYQYLACVSLSYCNLHIRTFTAAAVLHLCVVLVLQKLKFRTAILSWLMAAKVSTWSTMRVFCMRVAMVHEQCDSCGPSCSLPQVTTRHAVAGSLMHKQSRLHELEQLNSCYP